MAVETRPAAAVAPGEPLLVASGLSKRFGGLAALENVDLTIRKGEILGVLGPNGAGKTTFVNCVSGLDKPTSGRILFGGADITPMPSHRIGRLGLARTFQIVKPLRQLTVLDNVAVGAMFAPAVHDIRLADRGDIRRPPVFHRQTVEVTAVFGRQLADERRAPKRLEAVRFA